MFEKLELTTSPAKIYLNCAAVIALAAQLISRMDRKLHLHQKPNGQHYRITVEHTPKETKQLVELQRSISAQLPNFSPKEPNFIHLTLIHLGIPSDIYNELKKHNPHLTLELVLDRFQELLWLLHERIQQYPLETKVVANHVSYYGSSKSPAVALTIQRTNQLDLMHQQVFVLLIKFIESVAIANPTEFIKSSRNFRHSSPEVFSPHITLGRVSQNPAKPPQLIEPIKLSIGQPHLAHVTVI